MRNKYRLPFYFTLIVAGVLVLFSIGIYLFYTNHQEHDFLRCLKPNGKAEGWELIGIMIIVFVLSLAVSWYAGIFYTKRLLEPVNDLIRQVDEIKVTDLGVVIQTRSRDEIGELAMTVNKLLLRIKNAFEREKFFISNASHELRTPLTSIKGQIEVALIRKRKKKDYSKVLESILDDAENMARIINGFFELAEANVDMANLVVKNIRVDELLFAMKEELMKRNHDDDVSIEFEKIPKTESEISISGNDGLLRMMFYNLVDNACKFSKDQKAIIKIDFDPSSIIIHIIDHGIGIPAGELALITQPLYRAENARKIKGHGLGLSIVQRIAEIHKAQIEFLSELNKGTTVILRFPKVS